MVVFGLNSVTILNTDLLCGSEQEGIKKTENNRTHLMEIIMSENHWWYVLHKEAKSCESIQPAV
jgi:hypothetical protein